MTKEEMATDKQKQCILNYICRRNTYAINLIGDRAISKLSKKEAWEIINKTVNYYKSKNTFEDPNDYYEYGICPWGEEF